MRLFIVLSVFFSMSVSAKTINLVEQREDLIIHAVSQLNQTSRGIVRPPTGQGCVVTLDFTATIVYRFLIRSNGIAFCDKTKKTIEGLDFKFPYKPSAHYGDFTFFYPSSRN